MTIKSSVYVAGPMRGIPYYNFPLFDAYAKLLREKGHIVMNPADLDREAADFDAMRLPSTTDWTKVPEGFSLMDCIVRDLDAVLACDEIHLLPGYEKSKGSLAELAVAIWAGKKVHKVQL